MTGSEAGFPKKTLWSFAFPHPNAAYVTGVGSTGGGGALSPFHQDADGVSHELVGHLQDLVGQRGADEHHLRGRGQVPVHVVNLLFETWARKRYARPEVQAGARFGQQRSPGTDVRRDAES